MKITLNFKLLLLTASLFALAFSACKKTDGALFMEATVKNTGDPAYDGCGWLIRIGSTNYSPTNLADQYKEDELKVSIRYETLTSKYLCGLAATPIPEIKLLEIRKK